jgi:hypothetical protein
VLFAAVQLWNGREFELDAGYSEKVWSVHCSLVHCVTFGKCDVAEHSYVSLTGAVDASIVEHVRGVPVLAPVALSTE